MSIDTRNNQDIFNKFVEEFINKDTPKCFGDGGCMYAPQGPGQIGCAVGMFLSEEEAIAWDNPCRGRGGPLSILGAFEHDPETYGKYFDVEQLGFLTRLQRFHDLLTIEHKRYNDRNMMREVYDIATEFGLTLPEIKRDTHDN